MKPFASFYINSSQRNNLQTPVSLFPWKDLEAAQDLLMHSWKIKSLVCTDISNGWTDQKEKPRFASYSPDKLS